MSKKEAAKRRFANRTAEKRRETKQSSRTKACFRKDGLTVIYRAKARDEQKGSREAAFCESHGGEKERNEAEQSDESMLSEGWADGNL